MKRWKWLLGCAVIAVGYFLTLAGVVRDPEDFTGTWYYAEDRSAYLFHNGVIISDKHHIAAGEEDIFSGAYSFGKDQIFLFFIGTNGVEQARELNLISDKDGEKLYDASQKCVVFYRKKEAIQ